MEYFVRGQTIRSHNTAKSYTEQSMAVANYLKSLQPVKNTLDFGCGKLRYSDILINLSKRVTFVDSRVQVSRTQQVRGERTTIAAYVAKQHPHCTVVVYEDLFKHNERYDLITCTNVLSAIPCKNTLHNVLSEMRRLLRERGKVVFVNQYRNSYFKRYKSGEKHLYGYLFSRDDRVSYYGIIKLDEMRTLLSTAGLSVMKDWTVGECYFIEAERSDKRHIRQLSKDTP